MGLFTNRHNFADEDLAQWDAQANSSYQPAMEIRSTVNREATYTLGSGYKKGGVIPDRTLDYTNPAQLFPSTGPKLTPLSYQGNPRAGSVERGYK